MKKRTTKLIGIVLAAGIFIFLCGIMNAAEAHKKNGFPGHHQKDGLTLQEQLGKNLYFDTNLSEPAGQACASCHHPFSGFADPDSAVPVSQGIIPDRFGNRNSPISAYAAYSPEPYRDEEGLYIGGQFWDGRAANLTEQAMGPFLNPLEMNNPDKRTVLKKILRSNYAGLFARICAKTLRNTDQAYRCAADAIAAYERTDELNQFSSKFDCFVATAGDAGAVDMSSMDGYKNMGLSDKELLGLALFNDPTKANCAACHLSSAPDDGSAPGAVFTDFSYDNLGVPPNPELLALPGNAGWVDYGLGASLGDPNENGKVKVMTLRNIARSAPYMHNGIFNTLHEVVDFYNTAADTTKWPAPEVSDNVNRDELGNLGLSAEEIDAIVAFLYTLTDGYICQ